MRRKKKTKEIDWTKIKTKSIGHPDGTYISHAIIGNKIRVQEKYNFLRLIIYILISSIPSVLGFIFSFREILLLIISFIILIGLLFYPSLKDVEYDGTGDDS